MIFFVLLVTFLNRFVILYLSEYRFFKVRKDQTTDLFTINEDASATFAVNVAVSGNLPLSGTTTTVNSTTTTVDDPVFTIGGDSAPGSDDNKDRGIEFRWHNGSAAKVGFFGFDDSTGKFTFIPDRSENGYSI